MEMKNLRVLYPTQAQVDILDAILKSYELTHSSSDRRGYPASYPHAFFAPEDKDIIQFGNNSSLSSHWTSVTFAEFISTVVTYAEEREERLVKLNNDYTAIINKETQIVQVGCQEITFERVLALARVVEEVMKID
jgi:hypothetical protein